MDAGELPAVAIMEGIFLLLAGALLLTPGFLTDAIGFCCLVPALRRALIVRFIESRVVETHGAATRRGHVIEGEFKREE